MNIPTCSIHASIRWPVLLAGLLIGLPGSVQADHPAGGNCKHTGGLYSLCEGGAAKCRVDGKPGRCQQRPAGCYCERRTAAVIENVVDDLRASFDVILTTDQLPQAEPDACAQIGVVSTHMTAAVPELTAFAAEPAFVSTGFLAKLDGLLRDLPAVELAASQGTHVCGTAVPPNLGAGLRQVKASYLGIFASTVAE